MYKPLQYIDTTKLSPGIIYNEYSPAYSLAEYVACFWSVNATCSNAPHRILPDGCIDILFDYNRNISFLTEISSETETLHLDGSIKFVGIRFLPKAIPYILKCNASEFINSGYEIKYVTPSLNEMSEKVLNTADIFKAIDIIQNELLAFFKNFIINDKFDRMLAQSLQSRGCLSVHDLASCHSLSEKQITRYFKENIGLPTKEFLNIVRFQNLLLIMKNQKNNNLHQSLDLGYYDQSHMIKDLNKYFGNIKNIY